MATNWKWVVIGLAAAPAIRNYYVQEFIAALMIFSLLFVSIAAVVFLLFVLDRVSEPIIAWIEVGIVRIAHWILGAVEGVSAIPASVQITHRSRKGQFKQSEKN